MKETTFKGRPDEGEDAVLSSVRAETKNGEISGSPKGKAYGSDFLVGLAAKKKELEEALESFDANPERIQGPGDGRRDH